MSRPRINPLSGVFSWFTGALSLLQLIDDFTRVKLVGLVHDWVTAYSLFVHQLSTFLFGWMRWRWFRVDENEGHVLVLACLLGAAIGRANVRLRHVRWRKMPLPERLRYFSTGFVTTVLPLLMLVVLIPNGTIPAAVVLAARATFVAFVVEFYGEAHVDQGFVVRAEIVGVVATALVLMLVNYMLIQSTGTP